MARRTIRFVGAACIIVLVVSLTQVLLAQRSAAQPEPATVQALLQEVQLLRIAIESSGLIASRMQLSLVRHDAEQQRAADLSELVRTLQAELAAITAEKLIEVQQADDLRESRKRATFPSGQVRFEYEILAAERRIEALNTRQQQVRAQGIDAVYALQAAEGRLNELNRRLDEIDHLLSQPPRRR